MPLNAKPRYHRAIVTTKDGVSRIMCMVQGMSLGGLNVHYIVVDSSLDELGYSFPLEERRSFRDELRGSGLAVNILPQPVLNVKELIETDLQLAYGEDASVDVCPVDTPWIGRLFDLGTQKE